MTLQSIEILTRRYADARATLAERVAGLHEEMTAAKRRRLPGIKSAVATAKQMRDEIEGAIATMPREFERPRTRIFHGIKVGFRKAKGVLSWADPARVVELIKKHFPDQAEVLIKTTETPVKDALALLPAGDLKKLGCSITDPDDQVVVAPVDGEVDKLVDALLKGAEDESTKEAA